MLTLAAFLLLGANLTVCVILERRQAAFGRKVDKLGLDVWSVKRAFQAETAAGRLLALRREAAPDRGHLKAVKPGHTPRK